MKALRRAVAEATKGDRWLLLDNVLAEPDFAGLD